MSKKNEHPVTTIVIEQDGEREIKFVLPADEGMTHSYTTDDGPIYFSLDEPPMFRRTHKVVYEWSEWIEKEDY